MACNPFSFINNFLCGLDDCRTSEHGAASIEGANACGHLVGIAVAVFDEVRINSQFVGEDLTKGSLVALSMVHGAAEECDAAGIIKANLCVFEIDLCDAGYGVGHADAAIFTFLQCFLTPRFEAFVIPNLQAIIQVLGEFTTII